MLIIFVSWLARHALDRAYIRATLPRRTEESETLMKLSIPLRLYEVRPPVEACTLTDGIAIYDSYAVMRLITENARSTSAFLKRMLNSVSIDITSTKLIPSSASAFNIG